MKTITKIVTSKPNIVECAALYKAKAIDTKMTTADNVIDFIINSLSLIQSYK